MSLMVVVSSLNNFSNNPKKMQVIWFLLRASRWSMAIAIITGLISGIGSAALIAIINTSVNSDNPASWLWPFLGIAGIALFTGIVSQFVLIDLAQNSVYNLRLDLSRRILAAPFQQLEELGASKLLASLTEDVTVISNTVSIIPFFCIDIAIIASCLAYLAFLSGTVFVVTIVLIVGSIAIIQVMIIRANKLFYGAREENDRLLQLFRSITDGIKELKLHWQRRQDFLDIELSTSAGVSRDRNVQGLKIFAVAASIGQLIFSVVMGILIFGMPQLLQLTVATLSGYVLTLTYLMTPFQNILQRLPVLLRANVAIRKIESMGIALAQSAEISQMPVATLPQVKTLELCNINHTYRGEEQSFQLGSIDLKFTSGELVFIVGGNGSGKSTMAKLLTGLYLPEQGEIKLNGQPITNENREWYRQHFAVVFSDFFLFEKLLGLGQDAVQLDAKAQHYLQLLQIEHKVQVKDGVLSTTNLSQGQRKRLALLTAYLEDRPIYLFDEWAADQDPLFRDIFYQQLLPELKQRGKLVFAISHDDRYFSIADRVVKLDYGQVEYDRAQ
jgi:putative pyoverdin transport system ATP-binding/permease protein